MYNILIQSNPIWSSGAPREQAASTVGPQLGMIALKLRLQSVRTRRLFWGKNVCLSVVCLLNYRRCTLRVYRIFFNSGHEHKEQNTTVT